MTFDPVLPSWLLITIACAIVAIRMIALYRVLLRTGPGRYRPVVLRWSGLTLAVLMLVVAAYRPGLESAEARGSSQPPSPTAAATANLNVFLIVDRSVDSRVEDYAEHTSRMAGIRDDALALVDQYPRARFSIIEFSSKAALLSPLSADAWGLKPLIEGLSTYTDVPEDAMYRVDAAAAADLLHEELTQARKQYKGSKNVVFYLGSGAGGTKATQGSFSAGDVAGGAVLGYGTTAGGPIPRSYVDGGLIYMADQKTGVALTSVLSQGTLNAIASQLGVTYYHRQKGQSISAVIPSVTAEPAPDANPVLASRTVERTELYWLFSLIAAALVLVEIYLTARDYRRTRMVRQDVTL